MKPVSLLTCFIATLSTSGVVLALEDIGDVAPGVSNNKIVVGAYDDAADVYTAPPVNVFLFAFGGDDPLQPFFTEDPGFRSKDEFFPADAVPFIPNANLSFTILSDLRYWDGNGAENFGPVSPGTLLTLDRGSFSVTVGTGESLPKTGLFLGTSDGSGIIHQHIGSTISNDFGDPLPGFYQFDMELFTNAAGIAKSDPFSITYELTPEPAGVLLLAVGLGLGLVRRRTGTARR